MRETYQTPSMISTRKKFFDILDPHSYDYEIEEIAHALSNICRYTGHCSPFYSVAEHSVYVSHLVPPEFALEGLLHDASEAYIGDVSKPLKELLPAYKAIEEEVEKAIANHFNLQFPYDESVHVADGQMYWSERLTVAKTDVHDSIYLQQFKDSGVRPLGLTPSEAKFSFLSRFKVITEGVRHVA